MDPLQSPRSPPPRPRPGGPRRPTTYKATPGTPQPFQRGLPDEAAPSYSGRSSPMFSSPSGSAASPVASNFDGSFTDFSQAPLTIRAFREQAVQVVPPPAPTPPVSRTVTPAVKVIAKQPTLTPPPALNFDSVAIQWRGMTLENAQWTMSSGELQDVVSRAIRKTAQENFIRLLNVKALEEELQAELERLDTLKATTQSQYRFNMHRRTMLLQSTLTLSAGDGDYTALSSLTTQLAGITAACDKQMLELLRIADQRAQIQHVQDVHVASALAMALRKLNASYAKRTNEVRQSREEIEQLKGELEEAWKAAQDMAQEMDDLDNFHSGFSSDEGDDGEDEQRMDESVRMAEVIGITGTAVAMKATLTQLAADKAKEREGSEYSRQRRVSAARKRSSRASKASLRLRKPSLKGSSTTPDYLSVHSRASGGSDRAQTAASSEEPVPPMPSLRVETATGKGPKGSSFLELVETRPVSPASPAPVPPTARPLPTGNHDENTQSGDSPSAHSRHSTFDFDIPPIAIYPAEESGAQGTPISRRVQSMQPSMSIRVASEEVGAGELKRASSEHRSVDGQTAVLVSAKHARRQSMPLAGAGAVITEGFRPDVGPSLTLEPSRVPSPPSYENTVPFPS